MNELTNTTAFGAVTMSSREIAELTQKQHKHVKRDIEKLLSDLGEDAPKFGHIYLDAMNREQSEYRLDRDLTENLLLGYSAELRRKVLIRLRELERKTSVPAIPQSYAEALRLAADQAEIIGQQTATIASMTPAVHALEQIAETHGSMCRTETAKHLGVPPHTLCKWMRTNMWTYRRPGTKDDLAYQSKINAGYLEHKVTTGPRPDGTEWIGTQVRVTPRGLTVLAKAFPRQAVAA